MPWLLAATRKRIVILQWKGYFLDKREVLRCLYKVFSIYAKFEKMRTIWDLSGVHKFRRLTPKLSVIIDNWLRNDDTDSLVN